MFLSIAGIAELSAISRQCLDRRIATPEVLEQEVVACVKERNVHAIKISWQFTTSDAREKLQRHYLAVRTSKKDHVSHEAKELSTSLAYP